MVFFSHIETLKRFSKLAAPCYNACMLAYCAVDIGGTNIRVAIYPEAGTQPIRQKKIATKGEGTAQFRLIQLITELCTADIKLAGIGIASPGMIDSRRGVILSAVNIAGWQNLALQKCLQDQFQVPVAVANDANLAALGEWKFGSGRGYHNLVYLTISTGIGSGIVIDDQLLLGEQGLAAEIGHITVDPGGPLCSCGQRGHLEAFSSGTAIQQFISQEISRGCPSLLTHTPHFTTIDISSAAEKGDELAIQGFERAGKYLGIALANLLHIFNPSIIILGGGVSQSGNLLINPMRAVLTEQVLSTHYLQDLVIKKAGLGDDAGLFGALTLARTLKF